MSSGRSQSPDGDPCSLLTPKDVESVIGRALTSRPFRSSSDGPLVEAGGPSCTYWLGNHRALTLAPQWSDGKQLFKAATMMGNLMDSKLGLTGASADTLDGPWDQVAAAGTGLVFLKGDQMLALSFATGGISLPAAVQLASRALRTLATQH